MFTHVSGYVPRNGSSFPLIARCLALPLAAVTGGNTILTAVNAVRRRRGEEDATAHFLVVVPHDAEQCLDAIEETIGMGPRFQMGYEWGCLVGDHTGYAYVEANGPQEAVEDFVPYELRDRARVHRLFTIKAEDLYRMRDDVGMQRRHRW
jgi:hypothetical protein